MGWGGGRGGGEADGGAGRETGGAPHPARGGRREAHPTPPDHTTPHPVAIGEHSSKSLVVASARLQNRAFPCSHRFQPCSQNYFLNAFRFLSVSNAFLLPPGQPMHPPHELTVNNHRTQILTTFQMPRAPPPIPPNRAFSNLLLLLLLLLRAPGSLVKCELSLLNDEGPY